MLHPVHRAAWQARWCWARAQLPGWKVCLQPTFAFSHGRTLFTHVWKGWAAMPAHAAFVHTIRAALQECWCWARALPPGWKVRLQPTFAFSHGRTLFTHVWKGWAAMPAHAAFVHTTRAAFAWPRRISALFTSRFASMLYMTSISSADTGLRDSKCSHNIFLFASDPDLDCFDTMARR